MELAKVIGQVVSTVRCPGLPYNSLLLVDLLNEKGESIGRSQVAADPIGAGAFSSRRIDPELLHAYSFPKSGNLCESGTLSKNYNVSCTRARSAA